MACQVAIKISCHIKKETELRIKEEEDSGENVWGQGG